MRNFDIHDRVFKFVIRGLKVVKYVPKTLENQIIINQYVRSITSVGANDQEADGVSSKRDFIHCYTIVRKELKETFYWLTLLSQLNEKLGQRMLDLLRENSELIKIVSVIISKAALKDQSKLVDLKLDN